MPQVRRADDKRVMENPETNHRRYLERIDFYRGFGYDLEKERDFILDSSMPVSGRILEIGTGKGHFALALAKRGFAFTSIDISEEEQKVARLNIEYHGLERQVDFRIEDAQSLSFPDRSFDAVFSINVFHHLEKPWAVLDELIRVLRAGGKMILSDFTAKGFEVINACHEHEGRSHDRSRHDLDEAKGYFLKKGFSAAEAQSEVQRVLIIKEKRSVTDT